MSSITKSQLRIYQLFLDANKQRNYWQSAFYSETKEREKCMQFNWYLSIWLISMQSMHNSRRWVFRSCENEEDWYMVKVDIFRIGVAIYVTAAENSQDFTKE